MAMTKRFTIKQHWQQISTGNVTLMGCNTVATYHVYVGTDTPTGDSDFISDTLTQSTPYNFDTPVWVKLNVTNQVDEADMIAIGTLVASNSNQTPSPDEPSLPIPLIFKQVINANANGDEQLTYTGGILPDTEIQGYIGKLDQQLVELKIVDVMTIKLEVVNTDLLDSNGKPSSFAIIITPNSEQIKVITPTRERFENFKVAVGDVLWWRVYSNSILIDNRTTFSGISFETLDFIQNAEMVVTVEGTSNLPIKSFSYG